jgi:hypothetical protein
MFTIGVVVYLLLTKPFHFQLPHLSLPSSPGLTSLPTGWSSEFDEIVTSMLDLVFLFSF